MDVEQAFLSRVILDEATKDAVNAHITVEFFNDDKWKRVYEYILDHWRKYSQAADENVIQGNFPSYRWEPSTYSFDYLVDALRVRRAKSIALDGLNEAAALVGSADAADVWKMIEIMKAAAMQARIETTPSLDMSHVDMIRELEDILHERMDNPGYLRGISTGFRGIDWVTGGFQPEQLVVMIGLPKSLKSSLLLWMCLEAQKQTKAALFMGFEMSNLEQMSRQASLLANVGLTKILNGTISTREHREIMVAVRQRELMRPIQYSTDLSNGTTLAGIQGKIMEYDPEITFIDSAYLMNSEIPKVEQGSAQALTDIARGLKKIAQTQRIPIVVTTQASETKTRGGKLNANSAMYTQAWRQSADVLLGVERLDPEQPDDGEVSIVLKVLATRSGPRADTFIAWNWSQGRVDEVITNGP